MKPLPVVALRIMAPCREDFDSMRAGRASRYCAACRKHVVDLSALTQREAEKALKTAQCVSAAYDENGHVVFRPERRSASPWGAMAVAASLSAACAEPASELGVEPSGIVTPEREPFESPRAPAQVDAPPACGVAPDRRHEAPSPASSTKQMPQPAKKYPRLMGDIL